MKNAKCRFDALRLLKALSLSKGGSARTSAHPPCAVYRPRRFDKPVKGLNVLLFHGRALASKGAKVEKNPPSREASA